MDEAPMMRRGSSASTMSTPHSRSKDAPSFVSMTPIEEYVAKYQVIKCSWRGKYERILALAPTRFCTIDPKDFEVTNSWSLKALLGVALDPTDSEGFTLNLQGTKKEEQLKLRCRFRSRLLSDLLRLQEQFSPRPNRTDFQFSCTKYTRKGAVLTCLVEIGMDGIRVLSADGYLQRSKYLYVEMEHLTSLVDLRDAFVIGYGGRNRLFFCNRRSQIIQKINEATAMLGHHIQSLNSSTMDAESIKYQRAEYGNNLDEAFVEFRVLKVTPKHKDPVPRILTLHQEVLVERDRTGGVVSCWRYRDMFALIRDQKSSKRFEIQYLNSEIRKYSSSDRDGVLAALYDLCITCNTSPNLFITCAANERGFKLSPLFASEDSNETQSFFGDYSIASCFMQRMSSIGKFGSTRKIGDKSFVEIVAEFNANVPASGIPNQTKHSVVVEALRPLVAQLYYISRAQLLATRSAVTLLQALCRIASSYYGFRELAHVQHFADSVTNLLIKGDDIVVFWTTLLLQKVTVHGRNGKANGESIPVASYDEMETHNKSVLLGNSYLVQSLVDLMGRIDVKGQRAKQERPVGPLVIMGVLQTFEAAVCSRKSTTLDKDFNFIVERVAKHHNTLLKVLFRSRCATTVEACTLMLKAVLEECSPSAAAAIRDDALLEGIVLRHFYQALFDSSFDQRCVSRYLISLWMSHHEPSKQLLSRILPSGFLPYLDEPLLSQDEVAKMDALEKETMLLDVDASMDMTSFFSADLYSMSSDGDETNDVSFSQGDEIDVGSEDSASGRFGNATSLDHYPGRRSDSFPSFAHNDIKPRRSSMSGQPRESFTSQIENDYTKSRMLQKLHHSVMLPKSTTRASGDSQPDDDSRRSDRSSQRRSSGRIRKRDIAYDFITNAISKAKIDKPFSRMPSSSPGGSLSVLSSAPRRRMQNFRLLFHLLSTEHEKVDLIWNRVTRDNLRHALYHEIKAFTHHQSEFAEGKACWNYEDFFVVYPSLMEEVKIGECYLKNLCRLHDVKVEADGCQREDKFICLRPDEVPLRNPQLVIEALYRRILREGVRAEYHNDITVTMWCVKSLAIIGAAYADSLHVGDFDEMDHLVTLAADTVHAPVFEGLVQVIRTMCLAPKNAKKLLVNPRSLEVILNILQMGHVSDRTKTQVPRMVWVVTFEYGDALGPLAVEGVRHLLLGNKLNLNNCLIHRDSDQAGSPGSQFSLAENAQLRWELGVHGDIDPLQLAYDAIEILLSVAHSNSLLERIFKDPAEGGKTKFASLFQCSQSRIQLWRNVHKILPLLVRYTHVELCEKVASLLNYLYAEPRPLEDEITQRSKMWQWGMFFMVFLVDTANFEPLAGLLKSTHHAQAGFDGDSVLHDILPEAMIELLDRSSAKAFAEVFCGEMNTPEVIWCQSMRTYLQQKCIAHLEDYIEYLQEDVSTPWMYCPMAPVKYESLEEELWCGGVYLGKFCEKEDYPVREPMEFMKKLSARWRFEANRMATTMTAQQAADELGVPVPTSSRHNREAIRAGFKEKARQLTPAGLSVLDYEQRLTRLRDAYWVLTCPRPSLLSAGHDPVYLLLILNSLVVMCNRYSKVFVNYEFDAYDLLLPLLFDHCTAEGVPPVETSTHQQLEISVCAAELLYNTCAVSSKNPDIVLDCEDIVILEKVVRHCVDEVIESDSCDHELLEVCFFIMQTVSGLMASPRGREWISGSTTLIVDMVRILWLWNRSEQKSFFLSKITQQVLEAISRMSVLPQNQLMLIERGILWQLVAIFLKYDPEIDDVTVRSRLQRTLNSVENDFMKMVDEVHNLLAIMSLRAFCRLGGIFASGSDLWSPHNPVVADFANMLFTPNVAQMLTLDSHHEFLKIFHGDCESHKLYWNQSMRKEIEEFISPSVAAEPSLQAVDNYARIRPFRFEYLAEVLNIGGLYIEKLIGHAYHIKDDITAKNLLAEDLTKNFLEDLLVFIETGRFRSSALCDGLGNNEIVYSGWRIDPEELQSVHRLAALHCLAVLSTIAPAIVEESVTEDAGRIKMLLRLLFPPDNDVHDADASGGLQPLVFSQALFQPSQLHASTVLMSLSALDVFGKMSCSLGVCDILIEAINISKDFGPRLLAILKNLCSNGSRGEISREILKTGCFLDLLGWLISVEDAVSDEEYVVLERLRTPVAQIFAEMASTTNPASDSTVAALNRFFPASMVYEITTHPSSFMAFYTTDHENPELIWNHEFRMFARSSMIRILNEYFTSPVEEDIDGTLRPSAVAMDLESIVIDYTDVYAEAKVGNVYVSLFLKNPTYDLRDPMFFATCLWEEFGRFFEDVARVTSSLRQTFSPDDERNAEGDTEVLYLLTSCLVCLMRVNPWVISRLSRMFIPERCLELMIKAIRQDCSEACLINVVRLLRVFATSADALSSLKPVCTPLLQNLLTLTEQTYRANPFIREAGWILEIIHRIVKNYPDHGEYDAGGGIVVICLRMGMVASFLDKLDDPDSFAHTRDPLAARGQIIEIINLIETDRHQAATAHQVLKKHKRWEKKYKFEPTQGALSNGNDDPYLERHAPGVEKILRSHVPRMSNEHNEGFARFGASISRPTLLTRSQSSPRTRDDQPLEASALSGTTTKRGINYRKLFNRQK